MLLSACPFCTRRCPLHSRLRLAAVVRRDGSDYSASIFGKLLRASAVQIWTDVDGVLSADPRKVPEAKVLPEVGTIDRLVFEPRVC